MEKKIIIALEILFVVIAIGYYTVKELIPDLKKQFGSSDKIVNPEKCNNIIEIRIDDNIDFMYLLDNEEKIYHIIFLSPQSLVLYNRNIENRNYDDVNKESIKLFIENNYLKTNSKISITRYNNKYYIKYKDSLFNILKYYNINTNFIENESNFIEMSKKLGIDTSTKSKMISELDYYSKELINNNSKSNIKNIVLSKDTSIKLANNVYKKIEKYVEANDITNIDKNNTKLLINTIPADDRAIYYPSTNSWYYVKDKRIYAYIEFNDNNMKYGHCYKGSIDSVREGECEINEENKY